MKLNKIEKIIKKTELECKVDTITLLSIEEYYRYRSLIPYLNKYWWLRSPGGYSYGAAYVDDMGVANRDGYNVYDTRISVRPALRLNMSDSAKLQPGNKV